MLLSFKFQSISRFLSPCNVAYEMATKRLDIEDENDGNSSFLEELMLQNLPITFRVLQGVCRSVARLDYFGIWSHDRKAF